MADDRLKQFALKLRDEVQTLAARLSQVEKIRAVARDGRDGLPGPKGDSVTRAEVEPGNMLAIWIGDVKTLAGRIVAQRGEKGDKGDPGLPGPKGDKGDPGKDGKDGTKITKVELNGRELFIWLDGVKKKVGQIAFPSLGGAGAGGGVRRLPQDNARIGLIDYNDLATQTTPINIPSGLVNVDIPNDTLGPFTNRKFRPDGITDVWNPDTGLFDWTDLKLGDMVDIRLDLAITTTSPNQTVIVELLIAIGGFEYTIPFVQANVKTVGTYPVNRYNGIYMGDENTLLKGAKFRIRSDAAATMVVNGWYCKLLIRG